MYGYEVFHEEILKSMIAAVRTEHVQHAYIFEGEPGIGRRKAAGLFAAALVCENGAVAPCGNCPPCIGAKADSNPDIRWVNSGDKKSIGVDTMREIVTDAYLQPFESKKKVYIIEEGDAITEQAQNSFLKMLEEPMAFSVFIILVSNLSMLLQTVVSRCSVVRFTRLSQARVKGYAQEYYPEADCDFLANYAEGNPGRIDEIMRNDSFFAQRKEAFKMIAALVSSRRRSAYMIADFLEENKDSAAQIIGFWQSMLRDVIFLQNNAKKAVMNSDMSEELAELSRRLPAKTCFIAEEKLQRAADMLGRYVNIRATALNLAFSIKKEVSSG